jgi:NADH-quinone oxidoreductase subunit G
MSDSIVNIKINGKSVQAKAGQTILEASHDANFKIPFLCKHPDLQATASCGICVVKVKGSANLVRACAAPIAEGMEITSRTGAHDGQEDRAGADPQRHPNECLTCERNAPASSTPARSSAYAATPC